MLRIKKKQKHAAADYLIGGDLSEFCQSIDREVFIYFFKDKCRLRANRSTLSIVFKGMTTKERQMDLAWSATSGCCIVKTKIETVATSDNKNRRERKKNSKNLGLTLIEEAMMWHEWRWPHSHTQRLLPLLKFETKPTPRKSRIKKKKKKKNNSSSSKNQHFNVPKW